MTAKCGTGRSFFATMVFAERVSQREARNRETEYFDESIVDPSINHADPLLSVVVCRLQPAVEGVVKNVPSVQRILSECDAEGNRLPLVAIKDRMYP